MNDKSFRQTGILSFFCILILLFCVSELCFTAQETLTLTTYYPAPFGMYKEMRADQMAIGSAYRHNPLYDGLLIVNGTVAIGTDTPAPGVQLEVSADTGGITGGIIRSTKTGGGYIEMYAMEYGSNPYGVIGTGEPGSSTGTSLLLNPLGGNVGIGSAIPPDALLHIQAILDKDVARFASDDHSLVVIDEDARLGVGIPDPKAAIHVNDSIIYKPRIGEPSTWAKVKEGELAYSGDNKLFYYYNGTDWLLQGGAAGGTGGGCYVSYKTTSPYCTIAGFVEQPGSLGDWGMCAKYGPDPEYNTATSFWGPPGIDADNDGNCLKVYDNGWVEYRFRKMGTAHLCCASGGGG